MSDPDATDLYARGLRTLLASWEANARGAPEARLTRIDGAAAAVFPAGPERQVYNNAVLDRDLPPQARRAAVEAMEAAYADAGIRSFAAWVHDSDEAMAAELRSRGYSLVESTRVMAMPLRGPVRRGDAGEVVPISWAAYLDHAYASGFPRKALAGVDPHAYRPLAARVGGETVGAVLAFDHEGDCGVFNLATVESARGRGIGTALTASLLDDALARGCTTASLQSTPIAERLYARMGFRDLGRFLELSPG